MKLQLLLDLVLLRYCSISVHPSLTFSEYVTLPCHYTVVSYTTWLYG